MEIVSKNIFYSSRSTVFNLRFLGDAHRGNVGFDERKFNQDIEEIDEDPNARWIGMGDYTECINPTDKRFDPQSIDPSYNIKDISRLTKIQSQETIAAFWPIRKKCLGICTGNHEENMRIHFYHDPAYEIAHAFNKGVRDENKKVKYMGYDGFIRLHFIRKAKNFNTKSPHTIITIYVSHGYGSARKSGAKVNKLEDVAHFIDADIIAIAHEHSKIIGHPVMKLGLDLAGKLIQKKQYTIMTGSYLRGYVQGGTTYVEKHLYAPTDLGAGKISIKPSTKMIKCEL